MTSRTVDLSNETAEKTEYKPIPQGQYEFELVSAQVKSPKEDFRQKDGVNTLALPFVELDIKVFGDGIKEEGRSVFPKPGLYLGLAPGKDGKLNYKRESGLLAIFESLGASKPVVDIIDHTRVNADGEEVTAEMLNPGQVAEIINQSLRGQRGKVYIAVKSETYNGTLRTKNEVKRYIAASATEGN